jgi:hypothetical protein
MTRQAAVERETELSSSSFYADRSRSRDINNSPKRDRGESPPPTFEAYFQERQRQQEQQQASGSATTATTTTTTTATVPPSASSTSSNSHFPRTPVPSSSSSPAPKNAGKTFRVMEREMPSVPSYMTTTDMEQPPAAPPSSYMMQNHHHNTTPSSTPPSRERPYAAAAAEDDRVPPTPPSPLDMYRNGPPRRSSSSPVQSSTLPPPTSTLNMPSYTTTMTAASSSDTTTSTTTISPALLDRLDRLAQQNSDFAKRLDSVEVQMTQTQVDTLRKTEDMLQKFRNDSQNQQEQFMQKVSTDISGLQSTLDKVRLDQQALKEAHEEQRRKLETTTKSQEAAWQQNLTTLEKTHNIRMTNMEQAAAETWQKQSQKLDQFQVSHQNDLATVKASLQADTQEKLDALQQAQIDRINALDELQQERLQNSIAKAMEENRMSMSPPPSVGRMGGPPPSMQDHPRDMNRRAPPSPSSSSFGEEDGEEDFPEEDEEEDDRPAPPRGMLRDRLMQQGGRGSSQQLYHKQDLVKPPQPMGPAPTKRRGGARDSFPEKDFYAAADETTDRDTANALGKYRSHPGDEPLPSNPLGRFQDPVVDRQPAMPPRREPAAAGPPPPSSAEAASRRPQENRPTPTPPNTPMIDRKLQHFLQETIENGPKDPFDKEMEALLLEKYTPLYPWLKTSNVQFIRSVLTTFLEHQGAQVEMDLRDASEQAAYEWEELMTILRMELGRITGAEPRIEVEGNNQWGIYSTAAKNHKAKERRRNFVVSETGP